MTKPVPSDETDRNETDAGAPPPGEPDTPKQAHDETAADVRALRHGDDIPQSDS